MFKLYDLNGREVSRQKAAASRSSQEARISYTFFGRPKGPENHRPSSRVTSAWEQDLQRYLSTGGRHIIVPDIRTSKRRTKSANPLFQHRALVEMLSAGVGTNRESEQSLTPSTTTHRATLPDVPDIELIPDLDDDQNVISTLNEECSTNAVPGENEPPNIEITDIDKGKLLRLRMAEIFSKAVDNEGMGISTFAYLDDVEEEEQLDIIFSDSDGPLSSRSSTYSKKRLQNKEEVTNVSCTNEYESSIPAQSAMDEKTKNTQTFLDLQKQLEDEYKADNFAFNKNAFKFNREKRLTKDAVRILTTPSAYRSPEMLQQARMAVITTTEEFSEFPLRMQGLIISHSWYESYSGRRMIIRQGQSAVNFYFIISGSVIVSVSRKHKLTGEPFEESVAILKAGQSFGVQPFPDDSVLESKLSTFRDWRLYKSQVLKQCISRL
ncbi:hypothetical protein EG68_02718 [Paragonimus skrjabini miyazakii]|uniref:Cyclic nucleotide-binding domain-containing protein n=1 Tax=Paragonimus skrjabini miyazakii TaxID=59628 RepID=A0A8S9YZ59_9TREM|nr:hypothetical protein EG68_02718 [Paragonimus skrjabini miyazakii]